MNILSSAQAMLCQFHIKAYNSFTKMDIRLNPKLAFCYVCLIYFAGSNYLYAAGNAVFSFKMAGLDSLLPPSLHPKFVNQVPQLPHIDATNGGTFELATEENDFYLGLTDASGLPMNTTAWGYTYNGMKMYLGPTFISFKNRPVELHWMNHFHYDHNHILPIDHSIHFAHPALGVPTVTQLAGGHTEPESDGQQEAWFTSDFAEIGPTWLKETYHYSLDQEAAMLYYHDNTLGLSRLNSYAGLMGMWIHRDQHELSMNLPSGEFERELIIQDKLFTPAGQFFFPSDPMNPLLPNPSAFPTFFGDYILVNGMAWPVMNVLPTQYRLRLLNGSDSRFYLLKMSNGMAFQQIGTEAGLLESPVPTTELLLAPGERADLVIDFHGLAGANVVLQNLGPDEAFRGFDADGNIIGAAADPASTGQVMMFKVAQAAGPNFNVPASLRQPIHRLGTANETRQLLIFNGRDAYGRMQPLLGTVKDGGIDWMNLVTETPKAGNIEIWEIYNSTPYVHPIRLPQVNFEIIDRQDFLATQNMLSGSMSNILLLGNPVVPASNEIGRRGTAVCYPNQRTRLKVRFDMPGEYAWTSQSFSLADHEMYRPVDIYPASVGNSPLPTNCDNIQIKAGSGNILIGGLDAAPNVSLEVSTVNGELYFACYGNCGDSKLINVANDSFYVKINMVGNYQQPVCELNRAVAVTDAVSGPTTQHLSVIGIKHEDYTEIKWSDNFGIVAEKYTLERNSNGVEFEPIQVESSLGGLSSQLYQAYDYLPANGENIYRIKIQLLDGSYRFSNTFSVFFNDLDDYILFPNPVSDFLTLNLETLTGKQDVSISIIDDLGRKQRAFTIVEVKNKTYQMNVRDLVEGHYELWINAPGRRAIAKSLIVIKS